MSEEIKSYDEYSDMRKRFYASKGVKKYNAFLANRIAFYVFDENYRDLKKCVDEHYRLSMHGPLWSIDRREELHEHITETTRQLHNFLSAAKTLIDNTRYFVKNTFGVESNAYQEYQQMVNQFFSGSSICGFTTDLRNNLTHVCAPFLSSVMGGSKATGRDLFTMKLMIKKCSESWTWNALAKKYAESKNGEIDLELFAKEYWEVVRSFYGLLTSRVESWGGDDWAAMSTMWDKLAAFERREDQGKTAH